MEKHRACSFFGLGILAFFLYFMEVSSAPSASATKSIINVMRNDEKLHNLPSFLYENNITKVCYNKTFPETGATQDMKEIFPCLAFYDTMYEVCEHNKVDQLLKNVTTFYSNIQNSSPKKSKSLTEFCKKIKDVTFSYEKLKPFFENIQFDNSDVCVGLCIGVDAKFIPLCAMLDWKHTLLNTKNHNEAQSNTLKTKIPPEQGIDLTLSKASNDAAVESKDYVTKKDKADPSKSDNEAQKNKVASISSEGNKPIFQPSVANSDEEVKQNTADNANSSPANKQKENMDNMNKQKNKVANIPSEGNMPTSKPSVANSDEKVKQNMADSANSSPANKHKEAETSPEKKANDPGNLEKPSVNDDKLEEPKKAKEPENTNANVASNTAGGNKNDANGDTVSTTLSENTEDHDTLPNQEDSSDDINAESIDAADQTADLPEQPSHKNIGSPYSSSMRADEESHFFTYFTVVSLISIAAYIGYHNKQKILAIVLEGRRSRNSRGRRRPSTANYRKLDCTLEEAVTSQCNANVTHVIY